MVRVHWLQYDTFLNIKVALSATTEELKRLIESQSGVSTGDQRLICNQRELQPQTSLEDQNLKPNSVATLLEQPEEVVCPEWLATGRCHVKGCALRGTHTMEYSPRYVAHHIRAVNKRNQQSPPMDPMMPITPPGDEAGFGSTSQPGNDVCLSSATIARPFTILQRPQFCEHASTTLSPAAMPFAAPQMPARCPSSEDLSADSPPFTPPRSSTTTPEVMPVTSLSPNATPFQLPCGSPSTAPLPCHSPQRPPHSPPAPASIATVSWDCQREVPLLQSPPREIPSIGKPLNAQPVPRRIDPTKTVAQHSALSCPSSLPWDTSKDAELVGAVTALRPVGMGCTSPLTCASPIWSSNATPLLQWGKLNYEPSPVARRGLKREATSSPCGHEHKVRWADAVKVCELTSVREFHLDPSMCLDTDDLETIFERCGMRVPLSPSTVAAS